jgi:cephalosporin hydroxylase
MQNFDFESDIKKRAYAYTNDSSLQALASEVLEQMNHKQYAYNYRWLGRPIIQIPQDTVTFQEMIWEVKPDCIIETGIAHGGSLLFSASMLAILESCSLVSHPQVIGIDIDIRMPNRSAIESHPLSRYIHMIEGSSIDNAVIDRVKLLASKHNKIMVFLDSNHTHSHVYQELLAYAPLVTDQSFCVVLDTGIEDLDPSAVAEHRPWCRGNSPKSALKEFLMNNSDFELDDYYHEKSIVTSFPGGIIRRVTSSR